MIVGEDTAAPRTLRVSSHMIAGSSWLVGAGLAGVVAFAVTIGMAYGRRHVQALRAGAIPADPATAVALLRDSVASLDRQTTALRIVAGLDTALAPLPDSGGSVGLLIHRADELSVNLDRVAAKLHADADKVARTPSIMPTAGWLTSQFSLSRFHPILHKYLPHLGIDVAAPYGTTVVAPAAGTVIRVGGLVLEIDHGNGIVTKYGHLSRFLSPTCCHRRFPIPCARLAGRPARRRTDRRQVCYFRQTSLSRSISGKSPSGSTCT